MARRYPLPQGRPRGLEIVGRPRGAPSLVGLGRLVILAGMPALTEPPRVSPPAPVTGRIEPDGSPFRRGVMLMLMTLVVPGSAQVVAGRRQTGWVALRIWFGLIA